MKAFVLIGFLMFSINVITFAGNPPAAVAQAFQRMFPNALKVKWGKESKMEWEAEFTVSGIEMSANFSEDGTWLETESELSASQLPENVSNAIKKQFVGWVILDAEKVETAQKGILYEVEVKKTGMKKKEILLKEDGTILK